MPTAQIQPEFDVSMELSMGSLSEGEVRDFAAVVVARHGDLALTHVAERIGSMIIAGDEAGVATWKAIARKIGWKLAIRA
jgi:Asp/Glu/hydantoin racemase